MGLSNVFQIGSSGMNAAKTGISTSGHNISNANTEGYSRQQVKTEAATPKAALANGRLVGTGTKLTSIDRVNDEYVEKQVRLAQHDLSGFEEKGLMLKQVEDVFNEMNGEGLNRLVSRFFNEFRKLSVEPNSEAIRESVRESSLAMIRDFKRIYSETKGVQNHIDHRIEGYMREANALSEEIKDLNIRIGNLDLRKANPNDLKDQRDLAIKKLNELLPISVHKNQQGHMNIDLVGVGPLVNGPIFQTLDVDRTPADDQGKPVNALDIRFSGAAQGTITHQIKGGKIGEILKVRDETISGIFERLDEIAYTLTQSVNRVHQMGFTESGLKGIQFFKELPQKERAAEFLDLSDSIKQSSENIVTAAAPFAPGDNRIAVAISGLQNLQLMREGKSTLDAAYNSMVSDVGILANRNQSNISQQRDIVSQLGKIREQVSGVSIDEETTNLLRFQHLFDASAKVIQVADQMLDTVLSLKR